MIKNNIVTSSKAVLTTNTTITSFSHLVNYFICFLYKKIKLIIQSPSPQPKMYIHTFFYPTRKKLFKLKRGLFHKKNSFSFWSSLIPIDNSNIVLKHQNKLNFKSVTNVCFKNALQNADLDSSIKKTPNKKIISHSAFSVISTGLNLFCLDLFHFI